MKKTLKRKSKRVPTKLRVKAEKKVREHNRKLRKEKRLGGASGAKKRRSIQVPAECPFKEAVLMEAEDARKRKEEERQRRREKLKAGLSGSKAPQVELGQLVEDANRKAEEFVDSKDEQQEESREHKSSHASTKAYFKEFSKVIDASDVILQVLDARDPLGTRSQEVERLVSAGGSGGGVGTKKLVLVLNKADLVPTENLTAWITYLRQEFPTVAFKSSTQSQSRGLGHSGISMKSASDAHLQTSKCVGAADLLSLLGNYSRRGGDLRTSTRVGVVGFPNVGKSSLINSLKRGRVCATGNVPGVTKSMQEVSLDSKVKLIDCPGLVLDSGPAGAALRNAVDTGKLEDLIAPVESILQRCGKEYLQLLYGVPEFSGVTEFLGLLGRHVGRVKKGGVSDEAAAAKKVLKDWNDGKIKYFTHPPERSAEETVVVAQFSEEFDVGKMTSKMETDGDGDKDAAPPPVDNDKKPDCTTGIDKRVSKKVLREVAESAAKLGDSAPVSVKKANKLRLKKEKKQGRRREKVAQELSDIMNSAL